MEVMLNQAKRGLFRKAKGRIYFLWKYSGKPASKSEAHAQLLKGLLYNNFIFGNSLTDFALERKKECCPITEGGQTAGCVTFGWRISRGNSGIG